MILWIDELPVEHVGIAKLKECFAATTRPAMFYHFLIYLQNRTTTQISRASRPGHSNLRRMTIVDHLKNIFRGVRNVR